MTTSTAAGPGLLDHLAARSTADLADLGSVDPLPADAEPAPGRWEIVDSRGIFIRHLQRTTGAPRVDSAGSVDLSDGAAGPGSGDGTGDADGGRPVQARADAWFVHGLTGSSTNWTALAALLNGWADGFMVDLPGHGRSDPPPRGRYDLTDMADLIAAAIRTRSRGPVHLVGNSLGGMVCVQIAVRHPELVRSLSLLSPAVPDLRWGDDRGADSRLALLLVPGTAGWANRRLSAVTARHRVRGLVEVCLGDPGLLSPREIDAAVADLEWRMPLPWAHTAVIGSLRALMTSYLRTRPAAFRALASRVQVPVVVVWGTRDRLVDPRLAETTAAAFRSGRLLILPGVGHIPQLEAPVMVARAIVATWTGSGAPHLAPTPTVATSCV